MTEITAKNINNFTVSYTFDVDYINECPICHWGMIPEILSAHYKPAIEQQFFDLYVMFQCTKCEEVFLCHYVINKVTNEHIPYRLYPENIKATKFTDINSISPQFANIYNQAEAAERYNLDEIAGCGYRKSIEYLVKDYLCYNIEELDEIEKIQNLPLGKAINKINDNKIQTLAKRATWIGNDETHYIRKHENLDIRTMKLFIKSLVNYIESELTYFEALSIEPN